MGLLDSLFGSGGSNSTSKTSNTDNRVGASDDAQVQVNAANSKTNNGFSTGNVAGGLTITNSDTDVINRALQTVETVVQLQSNSLATTNAAALGSISDSNQRLADLSTTKLTDGANLTNKTTMLGLAVVGALGVLFFLMTRKH